IYLLFCATIFFQNDELSSKLQNTLNKLINKNDLNVKATKLSNELLETLKLIENCKDKKTDGTDLDGFHKSIKEIEGCLDRLEEEEEEEEEEGYSIIYVLNK